MEYYDIYLKRLNRYGENFQERLQGQREAEFEEYLKKTVYKVQFPYEDRVETGSLEKYQQDDTKTLQYLLTRVGVDLPAGTIVTILDMDGVDQNWMVYYVERIQASGYNRYIMLRMSHYLAWTALDGSAQTSWAYMYGKRTSSLRDSLKSGSKNAIYFEDQNDHFFIMPRNQYIKRDVYFVIGEAPFQQQFRVTGYDIQSTEGVEYVTIDPIYEYDLTPAPEKQEGDSDEDFYWLNNGK